VFVGVRPLFSIGHRTRISSVLTIPAIIPAPLKQQILRLFFSPLLDRSEERGRHEIAVSLPFPMLKVTGRGFSSCHRKFFFSPLGFQWRGRFLGTCLPQILPPFVACSWTCLLRFYLLYLTGTIAIIEKTALAVLNPPDPAIPSFHSASLDPANTL